MAMALTSCLADNVVCAMDNIQHADGTSGGVFKFHNSYCKVGKADLLSHEDSQTFDTTMGDDQEVRPVALKVTSALEFAHLRANSGDARATILLSTTVLPGATLEATGQ